MSLTDSESEQISCMVFRRHFRVHCILKFIGIDRVDTTSKHHHQNFLFPLPLLPPLMLKSGERGLYH